MKEKCVQKTRHEGHEGPTAVHLYRPMGELMELRHIDSFPTLKAAKAFCEAKGVRIGDLNHALRVATTGVMVGPGMFDILAVLGREETLKRIEKALTAP